MFFVLFGYCVFYIARYNKDNIRQHPTLMLPKKRQRESTHYNALMLSQ